MPPGAQLVCHEASNWVRGWCGKVLDGQGAIACGLQLHNETEGNQSASRTASAVFSFHGLICRIAALDNDTGRQRRRDTASEGGLRALAR